MTPTCQHWSPHPVQFAGSCTIKEADGVPSYRYCAEFCKKWQGDGQQEFRKVYREQTPHRAVVVQLQQMQEAVTGGGCCGG